MNSRINTIKSFLNTDQSKIKRYTVYLLFLVLMIILHWNMSLNISDDAIFGEELKHETLLEHISHLYFITNGKVFADTMAAIFASINPFIWKALNIAMLFLMIICIDRLFITSRKIILSCFVILLLNFKFLVSAGYVASSVNYIWSSTALLISLLPLKYAYQFEKKPALFFGCWLAGLYAGNQEQSGAIITTVYTLFIVFCLVKKTRIHKYVWVQYIISILSLLFLFTAPGHTHKATTYNVFFIPDYLSLDIFEKVIRGFTSTAAVIITGQTIIWPLFCFLLMLIVWMRNKGVLIRLVSLFPLAASLLLGNFQDILPVNVIDKFSYYATWSFHMPDYTYIDASTYTKWQFYVPLVVSLVISGLVLLQILWAFGTETRGIIFFLIFAAGFCSRIIMGFSPTLYGAHYRTFIFLYLALGICIAIMLDELFIKKERVKAMIGFLVTFLCAAATYSDSLKSIM